MRAVSFFPNDKPAQGAISVSELLQLPAIQAVLGRTKWTRDMKDGVANAMKKRPYFNLVGATAEEQQQFTELNAKVKKLIEKDALVRGKIIFVYFPH